MRNIIVTVGFVVLTVASILSSFMSTDLTAYAKVICVDNKNVTRIIPCSETNAVPMTHTATSTNANTTKTSSSTAQALPAKIQLLFTRVDHTAGYIFTTHYVVWGKVANTGGTPSKPISVQINCNSNSGAPLYTTTILLRPSVLQPGDTGQFSQPVSSNDLQGTKYNFDCNAKPIEQK
jgi:type IV secretory pathway VirB6-like protein